MEFYNVIGKRRTVREFSSQSVPEDKILKILEAGIEAPTYNHLRECKSPEAMASTTL